MLSKLSKIYHTIRYLKPIQVYYQVWYRLRKKLFGNPNPKKNYKTAKSIHWQNVVFNNTCYLQNNSFSFLNIEHNFKTKIDWNYSQYGKLWTYNLNYFEFLHQHEINVEDALFLIKNYIENEANLKDGKEPYTISLRGINWIKFLSLNHIKDQQINQTLYKHYQILLKNLEYHLLGNHLLENGFSLLFGAYYFQDEKLYKTAKKIITAELNEEILNDGAHFEGSPMYHQIILHRLLDAIQLINKNQWKNDSLFGVMVNKAQLMLGWLQNITFNNGNIPMFNDCAYGIAPTSKALFNYAKQLGIETQNYPLSDSGYRKIIKHNFELCLDVAGIQPSYQPSHNHADTFNFELYYNNQPIVVDLGTSTYQKNKLRHLERSTKSHNTVTINNENSSHVWAGFRVAQRAKVNILKDDNFIIEAAHNGYLKKYNTLHKRQFNFLNEHLIIEDNVGDNTATARFHLHPSIKNIQLKANTVQLINKGIAFEFKGKSLAISIKDYDFCQGFNKTTKAKCIEVSFQERLVTSILKNRSEENEVVNYI